MNSEQVDDWLEETSTASMGLSKVNHSLILNPDEIGMVECTYPVIRLIHCYRDEPPKIFPLAKPKDVGFIFTQGLQNTIIHNTVNRAPLTDTPQEDKPTKTRARPNIHATLRTWKRRARMTTQTLRANSDAGKCHFSEELASKPQRKYRRTNLGGNISKSISLTTKVARQSCHSS